MGNKAKRHVGNKNMGVAAPPGVAMCKEIANKEAEPSAVHNNPPPTHCS